MSGETTRKMKCSKCGTFVDGKWNSGVLWWAYRCPCGFTSYETGEAVFKGEKERIERENREKGHRLLS